MVRFSPRFGGFFLFLSPLWLSLLLTVAVCFRVLYCCVLYHQRNHHQQPVISRFVFFTLPSRRCERAKVLVRKMCRYDLRFISHRCFMAVSEICAFWSSSFVKWCNVCHLLRGTGFWVLFFIFRGFSDLFGEEAKCWTHLYCFRFSDFCRMNLLMRDQSTVKDKSVSGHWEYIKNIFPPLFRTKSNVNLQ